MCVAIPGLVKRLKDGKVTVDFNGNEVDFGVGFFDEFDEVITVAIRGDEATGLPAGL